MEDSPTEYSIVIQPSATVSGPTNSLNLFPNSQIKFPKSGRKCCTNYGTINPNQISISPMNDRVANLPPDTR